VAIVLERAGTPQSTALRLEAYGVTAREREVATLIAPGRSNPEIAEALVLSPYTVQDHIKNLFEKTGVGARQELVARVFLDDYLPLVGGQHRWPRRAASARACDVRLAGGARVPSRALADSSVARAGFAAIGVS
jgi:DNA-binding CsgD family transcriptional regulator